MQELEKQTAHMKRTYKVKVTGRQAFIMIMLDALDDPMHVCRCIFGDKLELVE